MRTLYNAVWYAALPIALRAASGQNLEHRRWRGGAVAPGSSPRCGPAIWLHAASVGEVEGVAPLVLALLGGFKASTLYVTTMTVAGLEHAKRRLASATVQLAPLDHPRAVGKFVAAVKPTLLLVAETELWPNYFFQASAADARIAIVNGRISARSIRRYRWAGPLFVQALRKDDLVLAQSEDDAARYKSFGVEAAKIAVTGSTKLESAADQTSLPESLGRFAPKRPILVAGSTAAGEDEVVLEAFEQLRGEFSNLALVIAPRHLDRAAAVADLIEKRAQPYARASRPDTIANQSVMILDTIGDLRSFYRRAAIAFVGGSLFPGRGGQNLVEPAAAEVPVLLGSYHENHQLVANSLLAASGAKIVRDQGELIAACRELLANPARRKTMGSNARACIGSMGGAMMRGLPKLQALLKDALNAPQ
ncbi:MAG TPA: glycosyltransferase N-terminal domain-containing protein [Candidatus Binataceae bacterium]